jgi:hypothetical protein
VKLAVFLADTKVPVRLDLTCRVRHPRQRETSAAVRLNGEHVGELSCGTNWRTFTITLPAERLKQGLNDIALGWPAPRFPGAEAISAAAADLVAGVSPDAYCSYGDIHTFVASAEAVPFR